MKIELNKVYFEEKDNIGYLVINDPPANKTTALFLKELIFMVREYISQSKVKGIIITGKGRTYSSGADVDQLKEIVATQSKLDSNDNLVGYPIWYLENRATFNYFNSLDIPVISAIKGMCIGSGMELALCSHIRICSKNSLMGLPESTFGFLPGVTGTLRVLELVGLGKALELVFNGEILSVEEAMEIGLVDGIVSKKELLPYCEGLMKFILQNEKMYSKKYIEKYITEYNKVCKTSNNI
ncbi:MAG: enoyl-CoA hydratase/isomerase family protein [Halanaerobiales bacterium]|nr:enoyl-CoA hydratase/isomerase family protein [Halanaerobiales bacterium]